MEEKTKARSVAHSARCVKEKKISTLPVSMTRAYELDPLIEDLQNFSVPLKALSFFLPLTTISKEELQSEKQTKEHFPKA